MVHGSHRHEGDNLLTIYYSEPNASHLITLERSIKVLARLSQEKLQGNIFPGFSTFRKHHPEIRFPRHTTRQNFSYLFFAEYFRQCIPAFCLQLETRWNRRQPRLHRSTLRSWRDRRESRLCYIHFWSDCNSRMRWASRKRHPGNKRFGRLHPSILMDLLIYQTIKIDKKTTMKTGRIEPWANATPELKELPTLLYQEETNDAFLPLGDCIDRPALNSSRNSANELQK